jgi:23S rRNA pseudouridine1911/1915/1917 synthase
LISFLIQKTQDEGLRLDKYLVSQLSNLSRSKIQNWIRSGNILVNGLIKKTGYSLEINDEIKVDPPKVLEQNPKLLPENIDLDILHEDEDIIIINKQAGLVVHPGTGNPNGTLVNGLIHHFNSLSTINGETRPGIVHRLDADTSGVMVIAKTNAAHMHLSAQFQNREIKKKYIALTWGIWTDNNGEIDKPIARKKKDPTSYIVSDMGKQCSTKYEVEKKYRHLSKVSFFPKTGRTHQIRVHSAYLGFPIFGDEKYGGGIAKTRGFLPEFSQFYKRKIKRLKRHALHANRLEFTHPASKENIYFESSLPPDFLNLVNSIESFYEG